MSFCKLCYRALNRGDWSEPPVPSGNGITQIQNIRVKRHVCLEIADVSEYGNAMYCDCDGPHRRSRAKQPV